MWNEGWRRKALALAVLAGLAGMSWLTMEAGRPRWLVLILLAGFGLRILLAHSVGLAAPDASSDGKRGNRSQLDAGSGYDRGDDNSG